MVRKLFIFILRLRAFVTMPRGRQEGALASPEVSTIRLGGAPGRAGAGTSTARTGAE